MTTDGSPAYWHLLGRWEERLAELERRANADTTRNGRTAYQLRAEELRRCLDEARTVSEWGDPASREPLALGQLRDAFPAWTITQAGGAWHAVLATSGDPRPPRLVACSAAELADILRDFITGSGDLL